MHVEIQSRGFVPIAGLREYLQQRLLRGLGQIAGRVVAVVVHLSRGRRARSGEDMRCRICIRLAPALEVVVEDVRPDMYAAIEHAAARVVRAVWRSLRRSGQLPGPVLVAASTA